MREAHAATITTSEVSGAVVVRGVLWDMIRDPAEGKVWAAEVSDRRCNERFSEGVTYS